MLFQPPAPKPQPAQKPRYETRTDHDPDGIGKFYMGREIAQVMGHEGAAWLDRPERDAEEAPTLLLKALKIQPGQTVADIGAGSGYFTFKLARLVGPGGKVLAVDIQPEMLDIIRKKMRTSRMTNIVPVLGETADPKIAPNSTDLMLLVDVYHEFDQPYEMTREMVRSLKPGGRLVLVEYRGEDDRVPIKPLHKTTEAQIKREMSLFPLRFVENIGVLPRQHILIFRKE